MNEIQRVSLGELVRLERRPVAIASDFDYAEIGTYSHGKGIFHKPPRNGLEVGDKKLFAVREGDFILQITFAWEGAVALASVSENGMYGSVRYLTFRVDETRCHPFYLLNYFRTAEGVDQLVKISPGSAGRNRVLSVKRIPEVFVPLPSLDEQRRIVSRIEELTAKIAETSRLQEEIKQQMDALCRVLITNPTDGVLAPTDLSELLVMRKPDITVEATHSYHFAGVYCFGRGVFPGQRKEGAEFAYRSLTRIQKGNFVYPKLMAWEGALGIVPKNCDGLYVSPEFPVFEVRQDRVLPEVLDTYFRMPSVWPDLAAISTGTNVRRRRLHPRAFLQYKFPLPSMKVQHQLCAVRRSIEQAKIEQRESATELTALMPSILSKAFRGEL